MARRTKKPPPGWGERFRRYFSTAYWREVSINALGGVIAAVVLGIAGFLFWPTSSDPPAVIPPFTVPASQLPTPPTVPDIPRPPAGGVVPRRDSARMTFR
jgi:hypothetical protein